MRRIYFMAGMCLALGSCAQLQGAVTAVGGAEPQIAAACAALDRIAPYASLAPQAAVILPWVTAGCHTADGLAKLAADPSSVQWLGTLQGKLEALTGVKA